MKWDYKADIGLALPVQHNYAGFFSPGAINAGLFLNYCVGIEITGFSFTTVETRTGVQVNELELLAKLKGCQV